MSARTRLRLAASLVVVASIVVGPSSARAEPVGPLVRAAEGDGAATSVHAVYASFGLDGAFAATLGAATGLSGAGQRIALDGWADLTWAAGDVDARDMRYRVGARVDAVRAGGFRLRVALAPALRTTSNLGFRATALSTELRLSPGFHDERWSAELDLGLEQTWLTYIAPTDAYRASVYDGARSGWYGTTARTLRVGVAGALRLDPVEVTLRVGLERTGSLDFLPGVYGALGAAYRF